jgi:predicted RNase H-like HicB family nuclease
VRGPPTARSGSTCRKFGSSPEQALAEVEKAKDAWLASARDAGKPIPEPRYRPAIYARED